MGIQLGDIFGRIRIDASGARAGINDAQGALGGFGTTLGNIATVAIGNFIANGLNRLTSALGDTAGEIMDLGTDFESQMAIMSTAADTTVLSLDQLHDLSLQVGGDTDLIGVSATDAADSITGLYKAGLSAGEIFGDFNGYLAGTAELSGALRAAIDLAAASELDMVAASDLAAVTLATFGGELETEAERAEFINAAMNNFVQTADASVASVADLAAGMTNVGPTAAAFGWSLEDTNNALGILSTRGINGAEAGTALKSMMTNIMRPTDTVTEALNELGVELYDVDGNLRDLPDILGNFQDALYGTSEVTTFVGGRTAEQNELLDMARSQYDRATTAITKHNAGLKILSDDALARYIGEQSAANEIIAELSGITGDAVTSTRELTEEERNQYIQTLAGTYGMKAMNTLLAEGVEGWDDMAAAVGDAATISEVAAARTDTLAGAQEALQGALETVKIRVFEAVGPSVRMLTDRFSELVEQHGPAINEFFSTIGKAIEDVIRWVMLLRDDGDQLNDWIDSLPKPIKDLIAAFEDMIGSVKEAIGIISGDVGGSMEEFMPILEDAAGMMLELATNVLPVLGDAALWIAEHWEGFTGALIAVGAVLAGGAIVGALGSIVGAILSLATGIGPIIAIVAALGAAWSTDFMGMRTTITEFWNGVVKPAFAELQVWLSEKLGPSVGGLAAFWNDVLKPALAAVWAFLKGKLFPILAQLAEIYIETVVAYIKTLVTFWVDVLIPAMGKVWEFISGTLIPLFVTLWDWLSTEIPAAIETLRGFWEDVLKPALEIVWDFIQTSLFPLFQSLVDFLNAAFTLALTALAGLWENILQPALKAVWDFIVTSLQPVFEKLQEFWDETLGPAITTLADLLKTTLLEAWTTVTDALSNAQTQILDPLRETFDKIKEAISGVIDKITAFTDRIKEVELPWWLTPGSPTPFELGLTGISAAMKELVGYRLPELQAALSLSAAPQSAMAGAGAAGNSLSIYGDVLVPGVDDAPSLLEQLQGLAA